MAEKVKFSFVNRMLWEELMIPTYLNASVCMMKLGRTTN